MKPFNQLTRSLALRPYLQRSNSSAIWLLIVNYGLVALAFALSALMPHWWAILISLTILGNRQLGLGVLMHDCAHGALFKTKSMNVTIGEWLCAAPILAQLRGYQKYHLQHHIKAGTENDPDYPNYKPYPVSTKSLFRKLARDLFGITGVKNFVFLLKMHAGVIEYDMAYKNTASDSKLSWSNIVKNLFLNLFRSVICHIILLTLLALSGNAYLYILWWVAYLTTFALFSRIRNAAEHANVPDLLNKDPRLHARTVYANWLECLTVAPNHVNFHLEHHWMPQVPPYNLAKLHEYLKQNHALAGAEVLPNYLHVIRKLA